MNSDKKMKISRLQLMNDNNKKQAGGESRTTSPMRRKSARVEEIDEDSPVLMRFTQDSGDDDLDVVWDWESPRSTKGHRIHRKRIVHSSPIPKKVQQQQCITQTQPKFYSLQAELEELANKLSGETNDTVEPNAGVFLKPDTPETDLFEDDSFDDEMIRCSQQVEQIYTEQNTIEINKNTIKCSLGCSNLNGNTCSCSNSSLVLDSGMKWMKKPPTEIEDDSFDQFLETINEQVLFNSNTKPAASSPRPNLKTPPTQSSPRAIARTNSVPATYLSTQTSSSNSTFTRTKSVDFPQTKCSPDEIEKKHQEARAKLELKKKQLEIERKRLQALEKLKRNRLLRLNAQKLK